MLVRGRRNTVSVDVNLARSVTTDEVFRVRYLKRHGVSVRGNGARHGEIWEGVELGPQIEILQTEAAAVQRNLRTGRRGLGLDAGDYNGRLHFEAFQHRHRIAQNCIKLESAFLRQPIHVSRVVRNGDCVLALAALAYKQCTKPGRFPVGRKLATFLNVRFSNIGVKTCQRKIPRNHQGIVGLSAICAPWTFDAGADGFNAGHAFGCLTEPAADNPARVRVNGVDGQDVLAVNKPYQRRAGRIHSPSGQKGQLHILIVKGTWVGGRRRR
jgi:hypothetical protein